MKEAAIERDRSGEKLSKMAGAFYRQPGMHCKNLINQVYQWIVSCVLDNFAICMIKIKIWKDISLESMENISSYVKGWPS